MGRREAQWLPPLHRPRRDGLGSGLSFGRGVASVCRISDIWGYAGWKPALLRDLRFLFEADTFSAACDIFLAGSVTKAGAVRLLVVWAFEDGRFGAPGGTSA